MYFYISYHTMAHRPQASAQASKLYEIQEEEEDEGIEIIPTGEQEEEEEEEDEQEDEGDDERDDYLDEDDDEPDIFAQMLLSSDRETIPDVLKGIQTALDSLVHVMEKQGRILFKISNILNKK